MTLSQKNGDKTISEMNKEPIETRCKNTKVLVLKKFYIDVKIKWFENYNRLKEEIDNDIENETYDILLPRPIYGF